MIDRHGRRRDIAFKGSGRTPFSRGGDGKAAVGPVLRELLIGEAMHALGIPTTRALAAVATGEPVQRERQLPGAVLTRVAASHLRVGTFQFFAARRRRWQRLRQLADYVIARHDPALVDRARSLPGAAAGAWSNGRRALIAQWMHVGFIHGVMNTDNMTISGETIDYGPCAFMEAYDPDDRVQLDRHGGRYAYGNQPRIAQWNLARFAETLLPLMRRRRRARRPGWRGHEVVNRFASCTRTASLPVWRAKLGLRQRSTDDATTVRWPTTCWRCCRRSRSTSRSAGGACATPPPATSAAAGAVRRPTRCRPGSSAGGRAVRSGRHLRGRRRRARSRMRRVNPWVIARNHRVEEALAAADEQDDLRPFERLLAGAASRTSRRRSRPPYAEPAPREVSAGYRTYCGT